MANTTLTDDPVLIRFRAASDAVYGTRNIERVVLFGSARGATHGMTPIMTSRYFSTIQGNFGMISGNCPHITTAILNDTDAVISAKPFPAGAWRELSPLMHEIRDDGVDV